MTLALIAAIVVAVAPAGATPRCQAWVAARGGIRQAVTCAPIDDPAVFRVPAFMLPDPGPDQVLTFCVSAVSPAGESACVGPDAIVVAPAPPRGPFLPVPQ